MSCEVCPEENESVEPAKMSAIQATGGSQLRTSGRRRFADQEDAVLPPPSRRSNSSFSLCW